MVFRDLPPSPWLKNYQIETTLYLFIFAVRVVRMVSVSIGLNSAVFYIQYVSLINMDFFHYYHLFFLSLFIIIINQVNYLFSDLNKYKGMQFNNIKSQKDFCMGYCRVKNTLLHIQNMTVRGKFYLAEPRRGELPFNDC